MSAARRAVRHEVAVGVLLLVGLAVLAYMAVQAGALRMDRGSIHVSALFDDVAGLTKGAVVSVAGVEAGRVESLGVEQGRARVDLAIDGHMELGRDVRARIRARSVLGEKYLALEPGAPGAEPLQDGDRIEATAGQVEIDQMLDALGPLLASADPRALGRALDAVSGAFADDPERMKRILIDAEALLHNLREASGEAPALALDARRAAEEVRAVAAEARPILQRADRVLTQAEEVTAGAPALLGDARAAVGEARDALGHLDASTEDLSTVLRNLAIYDRDEVRRLLREEGVLIRLRASEAEAP
ncbi:MAG: MCE family protein [Deltaproteobacteria bacterium]|nr:MCE family protein [Deltaproteobacteria bacterium]